LECERMAFARWSASHCSGPISASEKNLKIVVALA